VGYSIAYATLPFGKRLLVVHMRLLAVLVPAKLIDVMNPINNNN